MKMSGEATCLPKPELKRPWHADGAWCLAEETRMDKILDEPHGRGRLSVSDHPWLDCCRDLRDLLRPARLAALEAQMGLPTWGRCQIHLSPDSNGFQPPCFPQITSFKLCKTEISQRRK